MSTTANPPSNSPLSRNTTAHVSGSLQDPPANPPRWASVTPNWLRRRSSAWFCCRRPSPWRFATRPWNRAKPSRPSWRIPRPAFLPGSGCGQAWPTCSSDLADELLAEPGKGEATADDQGPAPGIRGGPAESGRRAHGLDQRTARRSGQWQTGGGPPRRRGHDLQEAAFPSGRYLLAAAMNITYP